MNAAEIKTSILDLLQHGGMTAAEVTDDLHLQDKKSTVAKCLSELKSQGKLATTVNDEKRNVYHLIIGEPKALKFEAEPVETTKPDTEFDYYGIKGSVITDQFKTYESALEAAKEWIKGESYSVDVVGVKITKLAKVEPVASVKVTEY